MGTFNPDEWNSRRSPLPRTGGPVRPTRASSDFRHEKPDYKTAALCKQVRRALSLALAGECGDPVLQTLIVEEVLPAPNAGRLLVRLLLSTRDGSPSVIEVLERLERVHGLLRASVGEAIVRKRTPELSFDILAVETRSSGPPEVHNE